MPSYGRVYDKPQEKATGRMGKKYARAPLDIGGVLKASSH